ncbi:hypothetical protein GCM10009682_59700 [Luedemannella flava]|uniref:Uncharacterized protein n=1 Tax=Luedemannella flava TaxID=349316 RepID=A0ABN2MNZ6_9ACTN
MLPSYEITPGSGVAQAQFGEAHRARLGEPVSFERVPGSGLIDAYGDVTLMLSYGDDDRLTEIEPGGADAVLNGVQLLDRPLGEVLDDLRSAGLAPEFVGDCAFEIRGLGLYLISPAPEETDVPTESGSIRPLTAA